MADPLTDYRATYRRQEMALPALLGILGVLGLGVWATLSTTGDRAMTIMLGTAGFCLFATFFLMLGVFRVHRWRVEADGVHIEERPKVPLMGLRHRATIAYADIVSLRRVESGFVRLIEIVTRSGRQYRMPQAMLTDPRGMPHVDPDADLDVFAATIRAVAAREGHALPELSEGLSFWNRPFGLACQGIMLLASLAIAAAVLFALFGGGIEPGQPRGGQATAILVLLPVGAAYLLRKSLRRRKAVLASMRERAVALAT